MSSIKRELERKEGIADTARAVAEETGAIEECDDHSGEYIDQSDDEAVSQAYAIMTNKVKSGEIEGTREEAIEALKQVLDDAGSDCSLCAEQMGRDD